MTDFSTQRRNKEEGVSLHFGAKLMRPEQTPVKRILPQQIGRKF